MVGSEREYQQKRQSYSGRRRLIGQNKVRNIQCQLDIGLEEEVIGGREEWQQEERGREQGY